MRVSKDGSRLQKLMLLGNDSLLPEELGPVRRYLALAMLLLSLAVFCWGLHDKLSLYAPPTVPPPVARAKLLSPAEQLSAQVRIAMPRPPQSVPPLLLLFFLAGLGSREVTKPELRRPLQRPPLIPQLQHRPPPALLLS